MNTDHNQAEPGFSNQHNLSGNEAESNLLKNYSRYPVQFERGDGYWLYDNSGKKYLDFLSGIAVFGLGYNNIKIKNAVMNQLNKLWHTSNLFESSQQEILAKALVKRSKLDYVFFCNSGTEANEAAIKFARKWGKSRTNIICARNSFHGRTMGSLSATGQEKLWQGFLPLTPGFSFVEYGNESDLINEYHKNPENIVAVMLEPIQGESGIIVPPKNYLKSIRNFCDENNLLLIIDEIQSGMGRTGKLFCYQWEDIIPDIISVAKGIANGLPLGAVICSKAVGNEIKPGDHGSTFGGNPVSLSAALSVIEQIDSDILQSNIIIGSTIIEAIEELNSDKIKEVRGMGLMIGVEFKEGISAKKLAKELLAKNIVVGTSSDSVLRLLPPFIIDLKAISLFIDGLKKALDEL
jgi:acetylornithine/N-succinyldiaminopimelate aminotransferase